jgi:hypothetical protein
MKDKTIDYILRATWQVVSRMYNEEASKYGATMATGFALLSMDKNIGTFYIIGTTNGNGGYKSNQNSKINGRERLNHPKEKMIRCFNLLD